MTNKDIEDILIKKITENGIPVITSFHQWDSSATIYVKSEDNVWVDDYGLSFIKEESLKKFPKLGIQDLTEEGLYKLYKYGVRPNDKDWEDIIDSIEVMET